MKNMEEKLRSTNQIQDGKVSGKEKADKNEEEVEEEEVVVEEEEGVTVDKKEKARWYSIW